jgi:hypothetical protein
LIGIFSVLATNATAYEDEQAVPLVIDSRLSNTRVSDFTISLDGRSVAIHFDLNNETSAVMKNGYYAYTPLFHRHCIAENNDDKSFSDLRVMFNDVPIKISGERRAFFLGKDITSKVKSSGLDPLPDENYAFEKIKKIPPQFGIRLEDGRDWEGFVSYSWVVSLPPMATGGVTIRYQGLPQFSVEELMSNDFSNLIMQHCGNPDQIIKKIHAIDSGINYVIAQKYVIPVPFMYESDVNVNISQPSQDWLGGHPIFSLVCGVTQGNGSSFPVSGKIPYSDDYELSILIISRMAD